MKPALTTSIVIVLAVLIIGLLWWYTNQAQPQPSTQEPAKQLIASVNYACDAGKTIQASFYAGSSTPSTNPNMPPTPGGSAKLVLSDGRSMTLPQTISADGMRYANTDESFIFWGKGTGAYVMESNVQTYTNCEAAMTLQQAISAAQGSECTQKGTLGSNGTYNPNSKTWWIDFTPNAANAHAGCAPACVVSASSTAEINWRCTGAIVPASFDDLITVDSPLPTAQIKSPLTVSGRARGSWYFEAVFPIKLYDGQGKLLTQSQGHAQGEWTTNEYVPFSATLTFVAPKTATGTLVLQNDNPSGDPAKNKELRIPVTFTATRQ